MEKNCERCGSIFITKPSHFDRRIYCSRKCNGLSKQTHEKRACIICFKSFKFYASCKNATGQFCSHQCKGKAFFIPRPIKKCVKCNKEFTASLSYKIKKYCSNDCYAQTMEGTTKPSFWENASKEDQLKRLQKAFDKYVIKNIEGCWGWKGSHCQKYGRLQYGGKYKSIGAHKGSWILHFGDIPDGMFICHKCDNPICTNPEHLFLGTPTDNVHDMIKKGRRRVVASEDSSGAKLTNDEVIEIKKLLKNGISLTDIAKTFNVHIVTIHDIKYNKTWKNTEG